MISLEIIEKPIENLWFLPLFGANLPKPVKTKENSMISLEIVEKPLENQCFPKIDQ